MNPDDLIDLEYPDSITVHTRDAEFDLEVLRVDGDSPEDGVLMCRPLDPPSGTIQVFFLIIEGWDCLPELHGAEYTTDGEGDSRAVDGVGLVDDIEIHSE